MNKTLVIAGNFRQYVDYKNSKPNPEDYRYVSKPDTIRGIRDPHGVFIGTWRSREDIKEILQVLILSSRTPNKTLEELYALY